MTVKHTQFWVILWCVACTGTHPLIGAMQFWVFPHGVQQDARRLTPSARSMTGKNQKQELFSSTSDVRGGFVSGCVLFSWNGKSVVNTNPLSLLLMLRIFGSAPSLTMALTFCLSLWLRLVRMWHREAVTSLGRSVPVSSLGSIATTSGNTCFTSGRQNKRQIESVKNFVVESETKWQVNM